MKIIIPIEEFRIMDTKFQKEVDNDIYPKIFEITVNVNNKSNDNYDGKLCKVLHIGKH